MAGASTLALDNPWPALAKEELQALAGDPEALLHQAEARDPQDVRRRLFDFNSIGVSQRVQPGLVLAGSKNG